LSVAEADGVSTDGLGSSLASFEHALRTRAVAAARAQYFLDTVMITPSGQSPTARATVPRSRAVHLHCPIHPSISEHHAAQSQTHRTPPPRNLLIQHERRVNSR